MRKTREYVVNKTVNIVINILAGGLSTFLILIMLAYFS